MVKIGRDGGHHIAVLVKRGLDSEGFKFVAEEFQEVQLLCGRRLGSAVFVTLRVYGHIFQETVKDIHCFDVFIDAYTV